MFTGIITDIGTIEQVEQMPEGRRFHVASIYDLDGIDIGASIAHDGVCLTVVEKTDKVFVVEASEEGTIVSRSVTGKPARIIKSKWTQLWEESEHEPLPMPYQTQISRPALVSANLAGRSQDINPGFAGQGIGMVKAVRPAAEIMADIVASLEETLGARFNALRG